MPFRRPNQKSGIFAAGDLEAGGGVHDHLNVGACDAQGARSGPITFAAPPAMGRPLARRGRRGLQGVLPVDTRPSRSRGSRELSPRRPATECYGEVRTRSAGPPIPPAPRSSGTLEAQLPATAAARSLQLDQQLRHWAKEVVLLEYRLFEELYRREASDHQRVRGDFELHAS